MSRPQYPPAGGLCSACCDCEPPVIFIAERGKNAQVCGPSSTTATNYSPTNSSYVTGGGSVIKTVTVTRDADANCVATISWTGNFTITGVSGTPYANVSATISWASNGTVTRTGTDDDGNELSSPVVESINGAFFSVWVGNGSVQPPSYGPPDSPTNALNAAVAALPDWPALADSGSEGGVSLSSEYVTEAAAGVAESKFQFRFKVPPNGLYQIAYTLQTILYNPDNTVLSTTNTNYTYSWDGNIPGDYNPADETTWPNSDTIIVSPPDVSGFGSGTVDMIDVYYGCVPSGTTPPTLWR